MNVGVANVDKALESACRKIVDAEKNCPANADDGFNYSDCNSCEMLGLKTAESDADLNRAINCWMKKFIRDSIDIEFFTEKEKEHE
jgi:hypothetical protein